MHMLRRGKMDQTSRLPILVGCLRNAKVNFLVFSINLEEGKLPNFILIKDKVLTLMVKNGRIYSPMKNTKGEIKFECAPSEEPVLIMFDDGTMYYNLAHDSDTFAYMFARLDQMKQEREFESCQMFHMLVEKFFHFCGKYVIEMVYEDMNPILEYSQKLLPE